MDNPSLILQTLDKHLKHEVRLVLYGRAALWLGFNSPPAEAGGTQDVDAIITTAQAAELANDSAFWDAIEATNAELADRGLYMTHLFNEREIFLRKEWQRDIVAVRRPILQNVCLFRPATIDLVLSKMMRGNDPQDMADAGIMIRQDHLSEAQLGEAFSQMQPIHLVELRDAFELAKPVVLRLATERGAT